MKFLVFYEKAPNNYCAFVPNLPVICLSTGGTVDEMRQNIREAMDFHIEGMLLDGDPIIEPSVWHEDLEFLLREDEPPLKCNVVLETSPTNNAAFCPDILGCWATGGTTEEAREELRQVTRFRLGDVESDDGVILPEPQSWGEFVEITLPVPAEGIAAAGP